MPSCRWMRQRSPRSRYSVCSSWQRRTSAASLANFVVVVVGRCRLQIDPGQAVERIIDHVQDMQRRSQEFGQGNAERQDLSRRRLEIDGRENIQGRQGQARLDDPNRARAAPQKLQGRVAQQHPPKASQLARADDGQVILPSQRFANDFEPGLPQCESPARGNLVICRRWTNSSRIGSGFFSRASASPASDCRDRAHEGLLAHVKHGKEMELGPAPLAPARYSAVSSPGPGY